MAPLPLWRATNTLVDSKMVNTTAKLLSRQYAEAGYGLRQFEVWVSDSLTKTFNWNRRPADS